MQQSLGDHLAHLVRRQGQNMAAFAQAVGLSPSTLSRVRTGQRLPSATQLETWADALKLEPEARQQLRELLMLAKTPPEVRARLAQAEQQASDEQGKRSRLEEDYGRYRRDQRYHDGWWLTFSNSFQNDGRIQRSLLRIADDRAELQVREYGRLHYSYHGSFETLGDKVFLRLTEDRGAVEHVQITLDSLFDYREPSFLYGLVCGISGKDVRHPISYPACSRMLMMFVARSEDLPEGGEQLTRLQAVLGSYAPESLRPCWPRFLGDGDWFAEVMRLGDEPLDAAILRLIDHRPRAGEHVLRAALGGSEAENGLETKPRSAVQS